MFGNTSIKAGSISPASKDVLCQKKKDQALNTAEGKINLGNGSQWNDIHGSQLHWTVKAICSMIHCYTWDLLYFPFILLSVQIKPLQLHFFMSLTQAKPKQKGLNLIDTYAKSTY